MPNNDLSSDKPMKITLAEKDLGIILSMAGLRTTLARRGMGINFAVTVLEINLAATFPGMKDI